MDFAEDIDLRKFKFLGLSIENINANKFLNIDLEFLKSRYDYLIISDTNNEVRNIFGYKKDSISIEDIAIGIFKNNILDVAVSIYEPQGSHLNKIKNVFTVYGHENVVNVYLDDLTFDVINTR